MGKSQPFQYLLIDVTQSQSQLLDIPPEVIRDYPSGAALATWLLSTHQPQHTDPLSPGSVVALAPGMFSGLPFPGATRMALVATSPLTGLWAGGVMGGEFAWALARTGWSAVVIQGRAPELCFLLFDEGRVFFRRASRLRGFSQRRATDELKRDWGSEAAVLCIGPAGEALVRFANVRDSSPEPGLRGGLGAVLGSKNLKALVLRPDQGRSIAQPEDFLGKVVPLIKRLGGTDETDGSVTVLDKLEKADALPGRNFQEVFKEPTWIDAVNKVPESKRACIGCPISCLRLASIESEDGGGQPRSELTLLPEHVWAAGPLVGLDSPEHTARVLIRCREQGLEPISFGGATAWAAEAVEKGIDLGLHFDSPAGFGRADWLADLPGLLVSNPQVRGLLGQGAAAAAQKIGGPAIALAAHYEGQELSYIDPRRHYLPLSFLGPAFVIWPWEEMNLETDEEETIDGLISREDQWALWQTLGLCPWAADAQEGLEEMLCEMFPLLDGRNVSPETLTGWSRGLIRLIKSFDWREGWRPFNQNVSPRFFEEDLISPDRVFSALDREERHGRMKKYFSRRGWGDDGRPIP
ncbi:MAG: aldehyde ferredoxin oxidoreductase N-terminal domain-containing protein [Deltaproteobacteria bacterium]